MYISPDNCRKFHKEIRDWKSGKTHKIPLRCKKPGECEYCREVDLVRYKRPIDAFKQDNQVYIAIVQEDDWESVRKVIKRTNSQGYARFPLGNGEFALVTDIYIHEHTQAANHLDIEAIITKTHELKKNGEDVSRRSATGIFSARDKEEGDKITVEWPEPVFMSKSGNIIPSSAIGDLIRNFLQYLSPLVEINEHNVAHYLHYRARLKAKIVTLVSDFHLLGFSVEERRILTDSLKNWDIIPLTAPERAQLTDNPIGKELLDAIFFGKLPDYEDKSWDVHDWTDYKDTEEFWLTK